jgi:hypothetical protein
MALTPQTSSGFNQREDATNGTVISYDPLRVLPKRGSCGRGEVRDLADGRFVFKKIKPRRAGYAGGLRLAMCERLHKGKTDSLL